MGAPFQPMGAPFQGSSSLHTAPIKLKSSIFLSSPSSFIYYNCKRSPVNDSSTRRCAVCAQNSNSPRSKSTNFDASSSKSAVLGDCPENEIVRVSSTAIRQRNSLIFSLVSLFDKRSLWRRIFLASKKVRSIILLNVVTIVYASSIPVVKEVEEFVDPATFNVVRFAMTAIPFFPLVLYKWDDVRNGTRVILDRNGSRVVSLIPDAELGHAPPPPPSIDQNGTWFDFSNRPLVRKQTIIRLSPSSPGELLRSQA